MPVTSDAFAAVKRLLAARYPTLQVDPRWLDRCVADACKHDAGLSSGQGDRLARAVRQLLLDTDLAEVVAPGSSRLGLEALRASSAKVGDGGRGAVLVQIESMMDIGCSAATQLEIAEARAEARRANKDPNEAYSGLQPDAAPPSLNRTAGACSADHMAAFDAQEEGKSQPATIFPRRMLKLELSDGSRGANVAAIELQRVSGLDMNTTRIGSKLLLKGAVVKDGYVLLTPQTVVIEGGGVSAKHAAAEDKLITLLRSQLGRPLREDAEAGSTRNAAGGVNAEPRSSRAATRVRESFSPDEDESMLLAALEAGDDEAFLLRGQRAHTKPCDGVARDKEPRSTRLNGPTRSTKAEGEPDSAGARYNAVRQETISLLESDEDDEFFAALDEGSMLGTGRGSLDASGSLVSNSRHEPIVIESSPEP